MKFQEISESIATKLSPRELKIVLRSAATGARIIADDKIVYAGVPTTIALSKTAAELWKKKGTELTRKLESTSFKKIIIKDFHNGNWITNKEFDLAIN